jgi:hypothetical protein
MRTEKTICLECGHIENDPERPDAGTRCPDCRAGGITVELSDRQDFRQVVYRQYLGPDDRTGVTLVSQNGTLISHQWSLVPDEPYERVTYPSMGEAVDWLLRSSLSRRVESALYILARRMYLCSV